MKFDLKFFVLALVLAAGVVVGRERPAVELVKERAPQAAASVDDDIDLDKLRRGESTLAQKDLFAAMRRDEPKPVAAAVPSEPAKPTAPPLPFQYIGKWSRGDKGEVLVMRGDELIGIERGQKLGDYRVDEINEKQLTFTYLPLKMKQSLAVPAVE